MAGIPRSKTKHISIFARVLLAAALVLGLTPTMPVGQAYADDWVLLDGATLFNGDENRSAVCEIFYADDSYIHRAINRVDDGGKGADLHLYEVGSSSKHLLTWDPEKQAYKIYGIYDQTNNPFTGHNKAENTGNRYVWDVDDDSGKAGKHIHVWSEKGESDKNVDYQRWRIYRSASTGLYRIQNVASGLYLGIEAGGGDTKIRQYAFDGGANFEIDLLAQGSKSTTEAYFGYSENWMSALPDAALLSSINIPGTHDTGTAHVDDSSGLVQISARDQHNYFEEQLNLGCRSFDIRINSPKSDSSASESNLTHTVSCQNRSTGKLYLSEIWEQALDFLEANPSEAVIFVCKPQDGDGKGTANAMAQLIKTELDKETDNDDGTVCRLWRGDEIPTLGEARGKIVLIRRHGLYNDVTSKYGLKDSDFGINASQWDNMDYDKQKYAIALNDSGGKVYAQDSYSHSSSGSKLDYIDGTFKQTTSGEHDYGAGKAYLFNYTSMSFLLNSTLDYTQSINPHLYNRGDGYLDNRYVGNVMFNFVDKPLARAVYSTNTAAGADFFVYGLGAARTSCEDVTYDGTPKTPEVTVEIEVMENGVKQTRTLVKDVDYEISYADNVAAGTATYTVTGLGPYEGQCTGTFQIKKPAAEVTIDENPTKVYDGTAVANPSAHSTSHGAISYEYYDAQGEPLVGGAPKDAESYSVVAISAETAAFGESRSEPMAFTIKPRGLSLALSIEQPTHTELYVVCEVTGFVGDDAMTTPGKVTFEVNNAAKTTVTAEIDETGKAVCNLSDVEVPNEFTVTATYQPDELGDYLACSASQTFDKTKFSRTIDGDSKIEKTYGDDSFNLKDAADLAPSEPSSGDIWSYEIADDVALSLDPSFLPTATIGSSGDLSIDHAGIIVVRATLEDSLGHFNPCSKLVAVEIEREPITVTAHAYRDGSEVESAQYGQLAGLTYGLECSDPSIDVTEDKFTNGHGKLACYGLPEHTGAGIDIDIPITKVGTGSIEYEGKTYENVFFSRDYAITFAGHLTIKPAPLTIKANDATGAYAAAEPAYTHTVSGLMPWDSEEAAITGEGVAFSLKGGAYADHEPGTYEDEIVPQAETSANYYIDEEKVESGTLTVNKGDPELAAMPSAYSKTYDGVAITAGWSAVDGFDGGDKVSTSWMRLDEDSGKYVPMEGDPVDTGEYRLVVESPGTDLFTAARSACDVSIYPVAQGEPTIDAPTLSCTGEEQSLGSVTPGSFGSTVRYGLAGSSSGDFQDWPTTPPTAKDAGTYTVCYYIEPADDNHAPMAGSYEVTIGPEDAQWISEKDQAWSKGTDRDPGLTFQTSAPFKTFASVLVDGSEVPQNDYSLREGSTIVDFKASYLDGLEPGTHSLAVRSQNTELAGSIAVDVPGADDRTNANSLADTGDGTSGAPWLILLAASGALALVAAVRIRRDRTRLR